MKLPEARFIPGNTGGQAFTLPVFLIAACLVAGGRRSTNCHFSGGCLYAIIAGNEAVFRLRLGVDGFD